MNIFAKIAAAAAAAMTFFTSCGGPVSDGRIDFNSDLRILRGTWYLAGLDQEFRISGNKFTLSLSATYRDEHSYAFSGTIGWPVEVAAFPPPPAWTIRGIGYLVGYEHFARNITIQTPAPHTSLVAEIYNPAGEVVCRLNAHPVDYELPARLSQIGVIVNNNSSGSCLQLNISETVILDRTL